MARCARAVEGHKTGDVHRAIRSLTERLIQTDLGTKRLLSHQAESGERAGHGRDGVRLPTTCSGI